MAEVWEGGAYANDTYLRSLAASSADVKRQVGNALSEIGKQRRVNTAQAAKVPGATQGIFQGAMTQVHDDSNQLGIPISQALVSGLGQHRDSMGKIAGLWKQGFGERETRQQGGVKNIQSELVTGLREKGAEYVSRRQQEDRERAHQTQIAAQQRALQEEMMRRQEAMQRAAMAQQAALANAPTAEELAWNNALAEYFRENPEALYGQSTTPAPTAAGRMAPEGRGIY